MRNMVIMLVLLGGTFFAGLAFGLDQQRSASLVLAIVFVFTGLGHFAKTEEMSEMIPPWVPKRGLIVVLSGVFEAILAVCLVFPQTSRPSAIVAIVFFVLALPLNIYSAFNRVSFGGHGQGPSYLWLRVPLQFVLIFWAYWLVLNHARLA